MEPRTRLDHALFQLTPTRTRCDLVIFAGKQKEKLATGLFAPFVSHLKSANDQISRGGYSITLRPPTTDAPWFTKGTLQRFVRFVTTPEVLERFVTLEKEIAQIEDSIQANETAIAAEGEGNEPPAAWDPQSMSTTAEAKGESNGGNADVSEENSKVHLQRILETRRAVLCKEQAMAYARSLVVGFELEHISDLIAFADAFGASRLRIACTNFMELCKRKNEDRMWMAEIAAMQASTQPHLPFLGNSGIILAGEDQAFQGGKPNGLMDVSSQGSPDTSLDGSLPMSAQAVHTDGKSQGPVWPGNHPQYMNGFQGHAFQQVNPYHGYFFPGMHGTPFYPVNKPWPPITENHELSDYRSHRSSSNRKKSSHRKGIGNRREESSTDPSGSSTESGSDMAEQQRRKRHIRKPSRRVVIRNINYINSKRDGEEGSRSEESSEEEELIDEESLKKQVEEAVGSLERKHKSTSGNRKKHSKSKKLGNGVADEESNNGNDNWDAFQNLLMKEKDADSFASEPSMIQDEAFPAKTGSSFSLEAESEVGIKRHACTDDSFIATKREAIFEGGARSILPEAGEGVRPNLRKTDNNQEDMMFPHIGGNAMSNPGAKLTDIVGESTSIRIQREGDCILSNQAGMSVDCEGDMKLRMFDGDDIQIERSKKDILPDDSFMIQEPLMANNQSDSLFKTDISIVTEIANTAEENNGNLDISRGRSLPLSEPEDLFMVLGRGAEAENTAALRTPEIDQEYDLFVSELNEISLPAEKNTNTSDLPPDDENVTVKNGKATGARRVPGKDSRMKSLGKGRPDPMSRGRKPPLGSRTTVPKSKSEQEEERRRRMEELLIQRQKRIAERSATNGAKKTVSATEKTTKSKPVLRSSTIDRLATARTAPKESAPPPKSGQHKPATKKSSAPAKPVAQRIPRGENEKPKAEKLVSQNNKDAVGGRESQIPSTKIKGETEETVSGVPAKSTEERIPPLPNNTEDCKGIKEPHRDSSAEKIEIKEAPQNNLDDRHSVKSAGDVEVSLPAEELKRDREISDTPKVACEEKCISDDMNEHPRETIVNTKPASPKKTVKFSDAGTEDKGRAEAEYLLPRFQEMGVSTPPSSEGMSTELSRKKWNSDENSPRAKGLRRLLFFGKKSKV